MKRRWTLVALLLIAAGGIGWRNHARLTFLRDENRRLAALAPAEISSVRLSQPGTGERSPFVPPGTRSERTASAKETAEAWIAWMNELSGKLDDPRWQQSPEVRARVADLTERLTSLDADQLKTVILALNAAQDGDGAELGGLIGFVCELLAEKQPHQTLDLISRMLGTNQCRHVLRIAMDRWAAGDPGAARAWFRENRSALVVPISDGTMSVEHEPLDGLLFGSAMHSTEAGMETVREFKLSASSFGYSIAPRVRTPEQRAAMVSLLRTWRRAPDCTSENRKGVENLLCGVVIGDEYNAVPFEDAVRRMEDYQFEADELMAIMRNAGDRLVSTEIQLWAEWLDSHLPDEAGRREVLQQIRKAWPQDTQQQRDAADAFAAKHGLE